jgi:hypothetical protein
MEVSKEKYWRRSSYTFYLGTSHAESTKGYQTLGKEETPPSTLHHSADRYTLSFPHPLFSAIRSA